MLKRIPLTVRLRPSQVLEADQGEALKIDRYNLDKEIRNQPGLYGWWASLYSEVVSKCKVIEDSLDVLEAELFMRYSREKVKSSHIKYRIRLNPKYQKLLARKRRWERAERQLKHAEKAFDQRHNMLQSLAANTRREKKSS